MNGIFSQPSSGEIPRRSHVLPIAGSSPYSSRPRPQPPSPTSGIGSATFYKWRSKFGGMDASMVSQIKELQDENRRLKKMYVNAQLSAELLKEGPVEKW